MRLIHPVLAMVLLAAPSLPGPRPPGPLASGPVPAPAGRFSWPLAPPHPVLRAFDPPPAPWASGHRGVDLGGSPGEPVLAAGAGVVVFAGQLADRPVVSVDHPGGLRTTYEPVTPVVVAGQPVARGALLGHLLPGHPGCPAAACLHWGLRRGEEYLNPLGLLGPHRVRLLPPGPRVAGPGAGRRVRPRRVPSAWRAAAAPHGCGVGRRETR